MKQKIKTHQQYLPVVLAIDTSCDDTSVAVTCGFEVWSNVVASQTNLHRQYGGIFPTVAKQAHLENIGPTIKLALKRAGLTWDDINQITITLGPGLAPSLEVGLKYAKQLAQEKKLPLNTAHHLEGHLLSVLAQPEPKGQRLPLQLRIARARQTTNLVLSQLKLPALGLIVSGKTTQFILISKARSSMKSQNLLIRRFYPNEQTPQLDRKPRLDLENNNSGIFHYRTLGQTVDDAAGEALDKIGRMVNLGYPAGPVIEELAKRGNPDAYPWPLPMTQSGDYNLSFSGLKTHARNFLRKKWGDQALSKTELSDFTASLQKAIFGHICYKLDKIIHDLSLTKVNQTKSKAIQSIWLGGGVAANATLRRMIRQTTQKIELKTPYSKKLCTDNAAMVGINLYQK